MVKLLLSFKGMFGISTGSSGDGPGCRRDPECELNTLQTLQLLPSQNAARASSLVTSGGFLNSEYLGITSTRCPAFQEWSQVRFCRTEVWEE